MQITTPKQNFGNGRAVVVANTGASDTIGMKSGYYGTNGASSVVYRGIEDFYGNAYVFLDGINIKDNLAYICQDPMQYASDVFLNPYIGVSYTLGSNATQTNIATLSLATNYPKIMLPIAVSSTSQVISDSAYGSVTGERVVKVNAANRGYSKYRII